MRISDWSSDVCSSDLWRDWRGLPAGRVALGAQRFSVVEAELPPADLARSAPQPRQRAAAVSGAGAGRRTDVDLVPAAGPPRRAAAGGGLRRAADPGSEPDLRGHRLRSRSEEHTSELQSLMRNSYSVF